MIKGAPYERFETDIYKNRLIEQPGCHSRLFFSKMAVEEGVNISLIEFNQL